MSSNWCERLVGVTKTFGGRFRFKVRGEAKVDPWGTWLINPTGSYLEIGPSGPYPTRELAWVEIEPDGAGPAALAEALAAVGVVGVVNCRRVRVPMPV